MVIFLDTNAIPRRGSLKSVIMSAVLQIASKRSIRVCLPSLVLEESVSARVRAATSAIEALGSASNEASKFFHVDSFYVPDVTELGEGWRSELAETFRIVDVVPDDALEALHREAHRQKPARDGAGGRDAAIWLTVKRFHLTHDGPTFLVSDNSKDFADPTGKVLHPALAAELGERANLFHYCRTLDGLLEHFADRVDAVVSVTQIGGFSDVISYAIASLPEVDRNIQKLSQYDEIKFDDLSISRVVRCYQVEDDHLALIDLRGRVSEETMAALELDGALQFRIKAWVEVESISSIAKNLYVDSTEKLA